MSRTKGALNKPKAIKQPIFSTFTPIEPVAAAEFAKYNPHNNSNAISIIKEADGNYRGEMQINGKLKTTRQISPETVLQYLLYHDDSSS